MRFLCFSFLSPPGTDAESACTGRFLSALAAEGHVVKLISLDHRSSRNHLDVETERELLNPSIEVVRMPIRNDSLIRRVFSKIKHGLFGICTEYIDYAIDIVREDLKRNPGTILITRSAWPTSNIVGWRCRKLAKMWIPHFSDPFPSYKRMRIKEYWRYPFAYLWLVRFLRDSSFISVTCHNAIRYFDAVTFNKFHSKFYITYHIGFPRLSSVGFSVPRDDTKKVIAHVGALFSGRPVARFAEFVSRIPGVRFLQFGKVYGHREGFDICKIESPKMATDAMATADAILVCDLDSGFGYTPYLPSKFAYALALGKPIICLTTPDSEMAMLSKKIRGVYYVDMTIPWGDEVVNLMEGLVNGDLCPPPISDVTFVMPETVAKGFLERVKETLGE